MDGSIDNNREWFASGGMNPRKNVTGAALVGSQRVCRPTAPKLIDVGDLTLQLISRVGQHAMDSV